MRALIINTVCGVGSTGRICMDTAKKFISEGHECYIAYGRGEVPEEIKKHTYKIGRRIDVLAHVLLTRLFDKHGFGSKKATERFLKWIEQYKPDMIWLHNLHGYYINIEMLFNWLIVHKEVTVKWTLHDCWAFTGHCCHFTYAKCNNWRTGCHNCIQKGSYPRSILLCRSVKNYIKKQELFSARKEMEIIVPSKWLGSLAKESFLGKYPIKVSYNTINPDVFKPNESNYRTILGIPDKHILLGVANDWNEKKGLYDLLDLHRLLDNSFSIILVGIKANQIRLICRYLLSKSVPCRIEKHWHKPICVCSEGDSIVSNDAVSAISVKDYKGASVILLPHSQSVQELTKIYTMADLFINTTYEDTYPTVNLEAQACGTAVLTYKTGGSVESVPLENQVSVGDVRELAQMINSRFV